MRASAIAIALVLSSVGSGCGAATGVVLGQLLCGAEDDACRARLFESGLSADLSTVTVGGEVYETAELFECRTHDGRRMIIAETSSYDSAAYTCLMNNGGAGGCTCVTYHPHRL